MLISYGNDVYLKALKTKAKKREKDTESNSESE